MQIGATALAVGLLAASAPFAYPAAPRDPKPDTFWGVSVPDPYRWLEDVDSPQTRAWVKAQGQLTRGYLDAVPQRAAIERAYRGLLNYEKLQAPQRAGPHWVYFRNSGLQNQSVLYVREHETGAARVLLDPNALSSDGTIAVSTTNFSADGRYLAYATQSAGSDWQTWHVRVVATGKDLPDTVSWSKFSGATWIGDRGFYYSGYDKPLAANPTLATLKAHKVWFHTLGRPQSKDRLVFADPAHPEQFFTVDTTEDERYVLFTRALIGSNSLAWKRRAEPDTAFRPLFALDDRTSYDVIGHDGTRFYIRTNWHAPRWRLAYVDVRDRAHALHNIAPQRADTLQAVSLIGDRFYLSYLHDAHSLVRITDRRGTPLGTLALPGIGSGGLPGGRRFDRIAYYAFTSFTFPTTIFRYDTRTRTSTVFARPRIAFDAKRYETDLDFARSKDGTRVPVFVTHRVGLRRDGSTPTIVYGYGGFDISLTPGFSSGTALWLKMGGAYAQVELRGGGEYGEAWHDAGRLGRKQHVFDDFIAAAEMLEAKKITSARKLAANGGSNGGLLVGAVLTQRPDLYGAAIPEVGVLDMLRYHKWTVGTAWIPEYGNADASRAAFDWLRAYSPDDNVRRARYPPTLVMTSDHDDRVFPAHSFKFAAALQYAQQADAPILLRVEFKGGHGAGRPIGKIIADEADRLAFLVKNLNFTPALTSTPPASTAPKPRRPGTDPSATAL